MTSLVQAELVKLRTVRSTGWLLGAGLALAVLLVLPTLALAGEEDIPPLGSVRSLEHALSASWFAGMVMLVLGILAVGTEHRHGTLVPTFLATPRRRRVVAAKMAAYSLTGAVYGVLTIAAVGAVAIAWTLVAGASLDWNEGLLGTAAGALVVVPLYALAGVGVGAIVRNSTAAVVGTLLWVVLFEQAVLPVVAPALARWLPAGVASAVTGSAGDDAVHPAIAAVVFTGYALLLAGAGSWLLTRRDQ